MPGYRRSFSHLPSQLLLHPYRLMSLEFTILLTMGLAAFVQNLAGFGFALISMPILAGTTGLALAAPLVALAGLFNGTFMWVYYRHSCQMNLVLGLLTASLIGIPVGLYGLKHIPEAIALVVLGLVIAAYALYALFIPSLPHLVSTRWNYGFGFVAGILTGSYNIPGPPMVLYGQCRRWTSDEFKANLTGYFWFNTAAVVIGHGFQHRLSGQVLHQFAIAIPAILLGFAAGTVLSRYVDSDKFRRLVFGLLLCTGLRLIWQGVAALS